MNNLNIKKFNKASGKILMLYAQALRDGMVRKPLAWALYQVWKIVDEEGD